MVQSLDRIQLCSRMIRSGTLLIHKGTTLPASIVLNSELTTDGFTAVESGAELLQLKTELARAGWSYFYMDQVKQTVVGGPARLASAMKGITAKMLLNECNSLQIDAVTPHSVFGIPCLSVSAHCCHIQQGMTFAGGKQ